MICTVLQQLFETGWHFEPVVVSPMHLCSIKICNKRFFFHYQPITTYTYTLLLKYFLSLFLFLFFYSIRPGIQPNRSPKKVFIKGSPAFAVRRSAIAEKGNFRINYRERLTQKGIPSSSNGRQETKRTRIRKRYYQKKKKR